MRMFAGLDVGFKRTAVCVVDEAGKIVWRGVVDTHPEALSRALQHWGGKLAKIGLESGSMTPWLVRELAKVGFPVVCMDARAAADAVSGCLCAGRDAADWVVPRGVCKVARQSPAEGHAGGARSVGASQVRSAIRCADYCGRLVFNCRRGRGLRSSPRRRIRRCGAITCSTRA